jgi:hypothetical protein
VDEDDPPLAVSVRMGVGLVRQTMSGPTRMAQAQKPWGTPISNRVQQFLEFPFRLLYLDFALEVQNSYAC